MHAKRQQLACGVRSNRRLGCAWSVISAVNWIAIASGGAGNGSGTVALSISVNLGTPRVGQVNIAGQAYTVAQDAPAVSASDPAPAPSPPPPPPASPPAT